jgi:hypothetical protein
VGQVLRERPAGGREHRNGEEQQARRVLEARVGRAAAGFPMLPRADRVRYEWPAADLSKHYRTTWSRDLAEAEKRLTKTLRLGCGRLAAP